MEGMEQLDTVISFRDGGSGIARELQRAASRANSTRSERNLLQAFRDISNWCDQFSLPKTISDIAKQLYKRSDEEKLLRGKPLEAVIAACIFIACRQAHVPRTFREICNLTHVSKKVLGQCYKALEQAFNLTPGASQDRHSITPSGTTGAEDLLVRYCNHLDLPPNVRALVADDADTNTDADTDHLNLRTPHILQRRRRRREPRLSGSSFHIFRWRARRVERRVRPELRRKRKRKWVHQRFRL